MAVEIERKFLVRGDAWRARAGPGVLMRQGYLAHSPSCTVRVRLADAGAWLTLKGATSGLSRHEFEYAVPLEDATGMLEQLCAGGRIEKIRYRVPVGRHEWEVDVFSGENAGLVLAEVELEHENEAFERPDWIGQEVSHDARYFNSQLSRRPYCSW